MTASKYEREIRFIANYTNKLAKDKEAILAKGELSEEDKKRIEEIDQDIEERLARKKEIEDSYIEAGLELPLTSRNLNASVYAIGASFEPVGRDYRATLIEETNARNAIAAKAYEGYEVPETDDIDELTAEVNDMTARLQNMESKILEADMNDEMGEKVRLQEEAAKLRNKRENTVNKIKALKSEGVRSASKSGVSMEFQEKIKRLEEQQDSLRSQVAYVRNDVYEMKDMLQQMMARLGIQRDDRDYNQDD